MTSLFVKKPKDEKNFSDQVAVDDLSDELSHEFLDSLLYVMLPVS